MLNNPNLLDAINNTIPFLTSATDLTSRMKRRMRMAREAPVWVKPFSEAFPWAADYEDSNAPTHWKRFSDGWMVILTGNSLNSPDQSFNLLIGGLHVRGMVEVPVLSVLKEVNPELHQEWLEVKSGPHGDSGLIDIQSFHFHVEDGMAVVGLGVRKDRKLSDIYVFNFSLEGHQLLKHIHIPATLETLEDEIFPRLNNTHFLTVSGERTPRHAQHTQSSQIYKINIYPLVATSGEKSQSPEIVITVPDYVTQAIRDSAIAFDHLGRVWFPFINTGIVSATNTPHIDNLHQSIYMHELPKSECGRWTILDPTAVLTKLQSSVSISPDETPVSPGRDLLEGKTGICRSKRSLHVLEFIDQPDRVYAPQLIRIREFIPQLHAVSAKSREITRGIPEELRKAHQGVSILGWYHSSAIQGTWPWGYFMRPGFPSGGQTPEQNLYLAPIRECDGESRLRLETNLRWKVAEAGGWKRVENGVPSYSNGLDRHIRTERDSWGDDGVMCWKMAYLYGDREECRSWVVCYEENWGTP